VSYVIQNNFNKVVKTKITLKIFSFLNREVITIINFFLFSLNYLIRSPINILIVALNKNFSSFYSGIITFIFKTKKNRNKFINSNIFYFINGTFGNIGNSYYIIGVRSAYFLYKKNFIFSYILFFNFFLILGKFLPFTLNTKLYLILNSVLHASVAFNNRNYKVFNY
jgi:hypothetical protein